MHLIHEELYDEMRAAGFEVTPGGIGENVTTRDIDLLGLPRGARLLLSESAVVEVTDLRNPCRQLHDYRPGLMRQCWAQLGINLGELSFRSSLCNQ